MHGVAAAATRTACAVEDRMLAKPETIPIYEVSTGCAQCQRPMLAVWNLMMRDNFDITTVIFAALAIFVLWKLWSVLGSRTGSERPPYNPFAKAEPKVVVDTPSAASDSNVVRLPGALPATAAVGNDNDVERWKGLAEPGSSVWQGLDAIARADPSFAAVTFIAGAKKAYEMIVMAFAAGDRKTLGSLLSKEVYDSFQAAIASREANGEKVETTFVSLDKVTIEEAQLKKPMSQLTVRFLSKLINVTRNASGAIVDGNAEKIVDMIDIWTFARDTTSRDPNWKLIATETGH